MPIIIWIVIGVCFVYFLLFLAIVIVYTRYVSIIKARNLSTSKLLKLENLPQIDNGKGGVGAGHSISWFSLVAKRFLSCSLGHQNLSPIEILLLNRNVDGNINRNLE